MKIGLQCSFDHGYMPLALLTWFSNKVEYANRHGYSTHVKVYHNNQNIKHGNASRSDIEYRLSHGYLKIDHVKNILEKTDVDWLWVTGCDSMVTNFNIKLEDVIDNNYHLIIASDQNAQVNADSFLIRNSPEGRHYIDTISKSVEQYKHQMWLENQAMIDMFVRFLPMTKLVPQRTINAYNYELYPLPKPNLDRLGTDGNWQKGDLLIHWPGVDFNRRMQLFNHYNSLIEE